MVRWSSNPKLTESDVLDPESSVPGDAVVREGLAAPCMQAAPILPLIKPWTVSRTRSAASAASSGAGLVPMRRRLAHSQVRPLQAAASSKLSAIGGRDSSLADVLRTLGAGTVGP